MSTDTYARSSSSSSHSSRSASTRRVLLATLTALTVVAACSSDETSSTGRATVGGDAASPTVSSTVTSTVTPTVSSTVSPTVTPTVSPTVSPAGSMGRASVCERRGTGSGASTEITVWVGLGGDQAPETFDRLVREFEMWNPEITVDAVPVVSSANARQLLRQADPADLPDLVMGGIDDTRLLADSGLFVPPSACWDGAPPVLDDLLPIIRSTVTVDGVLWSYPFTISVPVLLYDRTLLAETGVDLHDGPVTASESTGAESTGAESTGAELAAAVAALSESGAAPGGLALYDRSASWLIEQWAARRGDVLVRPDNGHGGHPVDGVRFATDEAVAALDWARGLYVDGLVTWVGLNLSGLDDLFRLIDVDDRASFTMHTSAALGDVARLVYDEGLDGLDDVEIGVAPLPSPTGGTGTLAGGSSLWLVDNDDPVSVGAAAHFAEFLMSPTSQATLAAATGYVPATVSGAEHPVTEAHWDEYPQFRVPYQQLADRGPSPAEVGMQIGPRVSVQRVLEEAAADVIVNGVDARDRLERAEREALGLIGRYEREFGLGDD